MDKSIKRSDIDLNYPMRLTVLGEMNSGKSTWVRQFISNLDKVTNIHSLNNKKIHVIYCYNYEPGTY